MSHSLHAVPCCKTPQERCIPITDAGGFFYFTQAGQGMHRISVNEDGYKPYNIEYDVGEISGDELQVELETK